MCLQGTRGLSSTIILLLLFPLNVPVFSDFESFQVLLLMTSPQHFIRKNFKHTAKLKEYLYAHHFDFTSDIVLFSISALYSLHPSPHLIFLMHFKVSCRHWYTSPNPLAHH